MDRSNGNARARSAWPKLVTFLATMLRAAKTYVGIGYPVDQRVSLTADYALAMEDARGTLSAAHTIKLGVGIQLN